MKKQNQKSLNLESYLEGLVQIGQRLEKATEDKNHSSVQNWFAYLQGYIRAYKEIKK